MTSPTSLSTAKPLAEGFVIVAMHKSPFGGIHAGRNIEDPGDFGAGAIRNILAPAFSEAGVDLVLAGHDHNYLRSFPMQGLTPQRKKAGDFISSTKDGLIYLVPYTAGQKAYPLVEASAKLRPWLNRRWQPANPPNSTAFTDILVTATSLQIRCQTVSGQVIDQFTVVH
jgi:hypothetical protein